jgi:hypothetical protein
LVNEKIYIKISVFSGLLPVGGRKHMERVNEDEYCGYILYSYMKTE